MSGRTALRLICAATLLLRAVGNMLTAVAVKGEAIGSDNLSAIPRIKRDEVLQGERIGVVGTRIPDEGYPVLSIAG